MKPNRPTRKSGYSKSELASIGMSNAQIKVVKKVKKMGAKLKGAVKKMYK